MKKHAYLYLVIIASLVAGLCLAPVSAKNVNDYEQIIPEVDGIYNVPGHPDLKVRVFVHKTRPSTAPTPTKVCGLSDPDSSALVDAAGWMLPANFTFNLNPNNVPSLVGSTNWPIIAENSFGVWENAANSTINITRGGDTTINRKALDGKNIIAWGSASGSALGVTYIWYNPTTKQIRELDTILNQKFVWTWSGGTSTCAYTNSYDAQNILTHELGHWFGLNDEYDASYANNTMFGYGYKKDAKGDTLTTGDINGLKAIYSL